MSMIYRSKASGKLVFAEPRTYQSYFNTEIKPGEIIHGFRIKPVNKSDFIFSTCWCSRKEFFEKFTPNLRLVG